NAYAHQDVPFEQVVEALQPERNLSHSPLFQVMFVFQNAPMGQLELPGVTLNPMLFESVTAKFDLTLSMWETQLGLTGWWEYNTDLFERETITRMTGHFHTLLTEIVAHPQQPISQLNLLTEPERHQLLVEWNHTQQEFPADCIHQLFEAQVQRTPDAVAVVMEHHYLTYAQLNSRANQLANHLQQMGVAPDTLVGICLERSVEMVVGLLGILKAGGAYVPLDPEYPQERLAYMLNDSQVPVLLTQTKLLDLLPDHEQVICLDTDWLLISSQSESNPVSGVKSSDLAYVIYTSGSTGMPKGTMILHQGVVNYLNWCTKAYTVSEGTGAPVQSSIAFDATITSLFSPLLVGQKVLLLPQKQEIEALSAVLSSQSDFSLVKLTPAHLELLAQLLSAQIAAKSTKALVIGGEALLGKSLSFWHKYAPNTRLFNEYGPTETVVGCCVYEVTQTTSLSQAIPIGRPIANTQLYILDQFGQPVPVGVRGELYIGGVGVARGYLNRPDLTAEKFILNPFQHSSAGDRLYKTGDIARYLKDGNIEYLGRIDNQVKIRGFRIELGEIEVVLAQHPQVRETTVIAREDEPGNKRLVAYVVPSHEAPTTSELRHFLLEWLPDYMVPHVFVMLPALPLTPNGKVDRRYLPIPEPSQRNLAAKFVPPRIPSEEILATIWSQVLGREQVGIHDNFFELGGDSILSIQIIARAHQAGLQLTLTQLFQYKTIAELAAFSGTSVSVQAQQGVVTGLLPLTPIQKWFFEQNLAYPAHFNQSLLLEVSADLKPELLKIVLQQLLVHHDALRLRFVTSDSGWQQLNAAPNETVPFDIIDLSEISSEEQPVAIETATTKLQTSLNLSEGPLMQAVLFHLGIDKPGRLLLIVHHLAVDGVSWRILLEDLSHAYQQISRGESIQLPAKTAAFKHWAERLMEYGQSPALAEEMDYWLDQSRSRVASLPVDYPYGKENNTVASANEVSVSLSVEQTRALLQEVPSAYKTQINDVLLTALMQSFCQWTKERSLLVDLEGHGREELFEDVDVSRTVGWFTSLYSVVLQQGEIDNPGEMLKSIKEQLRRVPKQGVGYGILRYLRQDEATRSQLQVLPQAELSFNYLGQLDQVLSASPPLLRLAKESRGSETNLLESRTHLLQVKGFVVSGKLQLDWTYSENVHQRNTIERLAEGFVSALQALINHCQSPEASGYTPSDFSGAKLNQTQLDKFIAKIKQPGRR
ncbi:MAG: amino acid adenylation domain-containing protein, partial [Stigonema ocellatum SAG 48.90 = DSM 106950]|nr:amino acid adenylation domain-containing protein [Stigonema ocellatum SAG 48.90 = DSM 106950]